LKVGLGIGLIVCLLAPLAALLFGVLTVFEAVAAILLLGGLWTVIFGLLFGNRRERLYHVGFGIIVAVLSTFVFLPIQYTAGLVIVSIIALVLASVAIHGRAGGDRISNHPM
jgi:hypothetical protein